MQDTEDEPATPGGSRLQSISLDTPADAGRPPLVSPLRGLREGVDPMGGSLSPELADSDNSGSPELEMNGVSPLRGLREGVDPMGGSLSPELAESPGPDDVASPGPSAVALATEGEQRLVRDVQSLWIPAWEDRLLAAVGTPIKLTPDPDRMVWWCGSKARLKSLTNIFKGGILDEAAVEMLVEAIERCCRAADEAKAALSNAVQWIELVNLDPSAGGSERGLEIAGGVLRYRCPFLCGVGGASGRGAYTELEFDGFLEGIFHHKETRLVAKAAAAVAHSSRELSELLKTEVRVVLDTPTIVEATPPEKRLALLRAMVTDFGKGRKLEESIKRTDGWLGKRAVGFLTVVHKATRAMDLGGGKSTQKHHVSGPPISRFALQAAKKGKQARSFEMEAADSPGLLKPLVQAFKLSCGYLFRPVSEKLEHEPSCVAAIRQTISQVVIENLPEGSERVLELRQNLESTGLIPTQFGEPPIEGGVLYYGGVFSAGPSGVWSAAEIEDFLDLHFRCREGRRRAEFEASELPRLRERLANAVSSGGGSGGGGATGGGESAGDAATAAATAVSVRFKWDAILGRLDQQNRSLCVTALFSKFCLHELVTAIEAVYAAAPGSTPIDTVVISSSEDDTPTIRYGKEERAIFYSPALRRGARGCLTLEGLKRELFAQFEVPEEALPRPSKMASWLGSTGGSTARAASDAGTKVKNSLWSFYR